MEAIECQRARVMAAGAVTGGSVGGTLSSASTEAGAPVGRRAALRERLSERSLRGKHKHGGGDSANESAEYGDAQEDEEAPEQTDTARGGSGNDRSGGAAVDLSPRQHEADPLEDITRSPGRSRKKIGIRVLSHALLPSRSAVISPTESPSAACSPSPSKSSPCSTLHEYNENRRRSLRRLAESESGGDSEGTTRSAVCIRNALFGKDISAPTTPTHSKEHDMHGTWVSPIAAFG